MEFETINLGGWHMDLAVSESVSKHTMYMIGANGTIVKVINIGKEEEKKPKRMEDRFLFLEV